MTPADTVRVPYTLNREDREWLAKHLELCGFRPDLPWMSMSFQDALTLGRDGLRRMELDASTWRLADPGLRRDDILVEAS